MNITVHDISDYLGDRVIVVQHNGNGKHYPITHPMPIDIATRGAITFCREENKNAVYETKADVIIAPRFTWMGDAKWIITVDDPYACFIDVCRHFFPSEVKREIHSSAVIAPGVIIGQNVSVGANAVIQHATIGDNVTIYPGAIIGADGFGFAHDNRDEGGALIRFPHYGRVILEDDVEVGANACIDRGTLGDTIIRKGVKIDNLVHVAHNADIGEHTALVALCEVSGSVTIGRESWIAPHAAIRQGQTLGEHVLAGLGAVIVTNVDDEQTVVGVPAKPMKGTS